MRLRISKRSTNGHSGTRTNRRTGSVEQMAQRSKQRSRGRRTNDRSRGRPTIEAPIVIPPTASTSLFGFEVSPEEIAANARASKMLLVRLLGPIALLLSIILAIVGYVALGIPLALLLVALVIGGTLAFGTSLNNTAVPYTLKLIGATKVDVSQEPRLANLVNSMVATVGLSAPSFAIIDDALPNACSVGSGADATLVVTRGLLTELDLIELEGVIAHELAHLRRGDGDRAALAVRCLAFRPGSRRSEALHRGVGIGRELRADQIGAASVRYPRGMASAMAICESGAQPQPSSFFASPAFLSTRWLWFDPMVGERSAEAACGNHDATSLRLAVLEEW